MSEMPRETHLRIGEVGIARVEVLVFLIAVGLTAGTAVFMVSRHQERVDRAGAVAQSRATLVDAAAAVENYAQGSDGFYSGLKDKGGEFLADYGMEVRKSVSVRVFDAGADWYCLRVTNNDLGPDDWRTATYSSADRTISPEDSCAS